MAGGSQDGGGDEEASKDNHVAHQDNGAAQTKKSSKRVLPWQVGATNWEEKAATGNKKKTSAAGNGTKTGTKTANASKKETTQRGLGPVGKKRKQETEAFQKAKRKPTIPNLKVPRAKSRKIKTVTEDEEDISSSGTEEMLMEQSKGANNKGKRNSNDDEDEFDAPEDDNQEELQTSRRTTRRLTRRPVYEVPDDSTDEDEDNKDAESAKKVSKQNENGSKGEKGNQEMQTKKDSEAKTDDEDEDVTDSDSDSGKPNGGFYKKMFSKALQHLADDDKAESLADSDSEKESSAEKTNTKAKPTVSLVKEASKDDASSRKKVDRMNSLSAQSTEFKSTNTNRGRRQSSSMETHTIETVSASESSRSIVAPNKSSTTSSSAQPLPSKRSGSFKDRLKALKEKTGQL